VTTKAYLAAASVSKVKSINRGMFSARVGQLRLWWSGALLAFGTFALITRELIEGEVGSMDSGILLRVAKIRTPWLTSVAVDLTALGSSTLVVLFSVFTLSVLLVLRDRWGALQLLTASVGAGILTLVTKNIIERVRPVEAQQLIVVSGFSYPSGHSVSTSALYLTIAIIAARYVHYSGAKTVILLAMSAVLILVAASRVYLGVHYATDVVSGVSLGAAWALLLTGFFTLHGHRRGH
jgi:undecaprenyl-diphosphatase